MITHEMRYRAGTSGLQALGFANRGPEWWCTCECWFFPAKPMGRRKTGNNHIEAVRGFERHIGARS